MQYHNASKAKLKDWHKVWGPSHQNVMKARDWCFGQNSKGKFFNRYYQKHWWFENEHDALMFSIKWSCDPAKQHLFSFKLEQTRVKAKSRKLKTSWTLA